MARSQTLRRNGSIITSGGFSFYVNYNGGTGNDFVLTTVPEPSTWAAGLLTLGAIGLTQRRRLAKWLRVVS